VDSLSSMDISSRL